MVGGGGLWSTGDRLEEERPFVGRGSAGWLDWIVELLGLHAAPARSNGACHVLVRAAALPFCARRGLPPPSPSTRPPRDAMPLLHRSCACEFHVPLARTTGPGHRETALRLLHQVRSVYARGEALASDLRAWLAGGTSRGAGAPELLCSWDHVRPMLKAMWLGFPVADQEAAPGRGRPSSLMPSGAFSGRRGEGLSRLSGMDGRMNGLSLAS